MSNFCVLTIKMELLYYLYLKYGLVVASSEFYSMSVICEGNCGSCYAFSSLAMNEARLRIASNNSIQLTFAPQDIVDCSKYSQGMSFTTVAVVQWLYIDIHCHLTLAVRAVNLSLFIALFTALFSRVQLWLR